MTDFVFVSAQNLQRFFDHVLAPYTLLPEVAQALKTHLVQANLWGIDSHGLQQIIGTVTKVHQQNLTCTILVRNW